MSEAQNEHAETPIVKPAQTNIIPVGSGPSRLLAIIEKGGRTPEEMTKVYDLLERMEDRYAKMQFNTALIAFQTECPQIPRSRKANIATQSGAKYSYDFADLEAIDRVVRPVLTKHGLSRRWGDTEVADGNLRVTFILAHEGGHSESIWSLPIPVHSKAGMSEAQKYGSALSYARRQAMVAGCGLTTCDPDMNGADPGMPQETIDHIKIQYLEKLMKETGADRDKFFATAGVEQLVDLTQAKYDELVRLLKLKKSKQG
ncbi:hypothetical protein LCGC14_1131320 [marine sediment metagenome]|uniref:ERF family protein n=1 Tax=marine sediment metagenome TaxID=412755 RepID=A0A0F9M0W8_9ZZZZ